jgi:GNAT superfamily N-acetyltransferase
MAPQLSTLVLVASLLLALRPPSIRVVVLAAMTSLLLVDKVSGFVVPSLFAPEQKESIYQPPTRSHAAKRTVFFSGQHELEVSPFTHADIQWKIRPQEGTPMTELWKWQAQANTFRLGFTLKGMDPPMIYFPPNWEQLLLEAWKDGKRLGRFGITCRKGPLAPPIEETIASLYGISAATTTTPTTNPDIGLAAIIFMFCEPEYRGRSLGSLALDVIDLIHQSIGSNYTLLVADDKSGGVKSLVKWYEGHGFSRAPKLQDFMGSPAMQFGVTMIGPTRKSNLPKHIKIEWW